MAKDANALTVNIESHPTTLRKGSHCLQRAGFIGQKDNGRHPDRTAEGVPSQAPPTGASIDFPP